MSLLSCCKEAHVPCSGLWDATTQESLHCTVLGTAVSRVALFSEDWSARLGAGQDQNTGDHDNHAARTGWSEAGGRAAVRSFLLSCFSQMLWFAAAVCLFVCCFFG